MEPAKCIRYLEYICRQWVIVAVSVVSMTVIAHSQIHSATPGQEMIAAWAKTCAQDIALAIEQAEHTGELECNGVFDRM